MRTLGPMKALIAQVVKRSNSRNWGETDEDVTDFLTWIATRSQANARAFSFAEPILHLRIDGGRLTVEICDDGRGAAALPSEDGFGIIGMRERVAAVGGTVETGPRPGGGWRVRAILPVGHSPIDVAPRADVKAAAAP